MSRSDAKAIVRRLFDDGWNQKKTEELHEYISERNIITGLLEMGPAGPDEYRNFMKPWHIGFPEFKYHVEAIVSENDLVSVRTTFTGTHRGPFTFGPRSFPPTDKAISVPEIFFFRVADGQNASFGVTVESNGIGAS